MNLIIVVRQTCKVVLYLKEKKKPMSSTTNLGTTLSSIDYYFNISTSIFILILGIIGNSLNIIVFISLKTFRKNPCAFSLILLSISDIGMLIFSIIPNILNGISMKYNGIGAIFACKISASFGQTFGLISYYIICLASIDQCFSTAMNERYKGISANIKRRIILICIFVCTLHGIPFLIYYNEQVLPGTNTTTCRLTDNNGSFSKYLMYVGLPIIAGFLPISIMSICGLISLRNVHNMTRRRVHLIRLRLEQQLTAMVLIKILCICLIMVPFLIAYIVRYTISSHNNDPLVQKQLLLVARVFTFLLFINYAVSNNDVG